MMDGKAGRISSNAPGASAGMRSSLFTAVVIYAFLRVLLSLTAASTLAAHPLHITPEIRGQYLGIPVERNPLLAPWQRFDALWYQRIAGRGYRAGDGSTVFRPLYPLLIRVLTAVVGNSLLAALLISNACFVALTALLHRFACELFGAAAALRATLLYVLFPSAFFLLSPFSEAPFLLCCAAALFAGHHGRWRWAGVMACLAALARNQGGVLIVPLAIMLWRRQGWGGWRAAGPWLCLPLLGTIAFPLYTSFAVHAPPVTVVLATQWNEPLRPPWEQIGRYVALIRAPGWSLINSPAGNYVELWDLGCALGFLVLLIMAARTLGLALTLYNTANWLVSLTLLHATSRYMLPLFPIFFALGHWITRRRLLFDVLLVVSFALYLFFAGQVVLWSWIG